MKAEELLKRIEDKQEELKDYLKKNRWRLRQSTIVTHRSWIIALDWVKEKLESYD